MIQISITEIKDEIKREKILLFPKNQIIIANHENSDLNLNIETDKTILAEIVLKNNKLFIISRNNKIPISINKEPIKYQEIRELHSEHIIAIADYQLQVEISEPPKVEKQFVEIRQETMPKQTEIKSPYLSIIFGNEELNKFVLGATSQEIYIGRDGDNEIIINKPSVSRKHAKIKKDISGFTIYDLLSTNGVYVNDFKIERNLKLKDGDIIRLGQVNDTKPVFLIFHNPAVEMPAKEFTSSPKPESQTIPPPLEDTSSIIYSNTELPFSKTLKSTKYNIILYSIPIIILAIIIFYFLLLPSFKDTPEISSIVPDIINNTDSFTIKGNNFSYKNITPQIIINDEYIIPSDFSNNEIKIQFPNRITKPAGIHIFNISVKSYDKISNPHKLKVRFSPIITELSTKKAFPGNKVSLYGDYFDADPKNITIFAADSAIIPESSTLNSITFQIPNVQPVKETVISIIAEINGLRSNSQMLLISPRKTNAYNLTFQIEKQKINDSEIYSIKTDFATLFLFTNPSNFSSVKERALNALSKLNNMINLLNKKYKIDITSKEENQNASILYNIISSFSNKHSVKIFEINDADANYYSQILKTPIKPINLADHLALVINDIIGLFIFHDYPINTANISNAGKALANIWFDYAQYEIPPNFMELIPEEQKLALANLTDELPISTPTISGNWIAAGDDLFLNTTNSSLKMYLKLKESQNNLTGSAILSIEAILDENNKFNHPLGSFELQANLINKKNKRFSFSLEIPKYGKVFFDAELIAASILGSYEIIQQNKKGFWQATYNPTK